MFYLHDVKVPDRMLNAPAFDLNQLDWSRGVDWSRKFIPESLTNLAYTRSYVRMTEVDRLKYNQITGLALCEQFIFLEKMILAPAIQNILVSNKFLLSESLKNYLIRFLDDEDKHAEMFWRILELASPERYPNRKLWIFNFRPHTIWGLKLVGNRPHLLQSWIWLALLFEERTIDIYREFRADSGVDPLFKKAHELHMSEEIFHVDMDRIFVDHCYAKTGYMGRYLSAKLYANIMARYTAPRRVAAIATAEIAKSSPAMQELRPQLLKELFQLKYDMDYQEKMFSRRAFPQTYGLMDRFPEMKLVEKAIPSYRHRERLRAAEVL